MIPTDTDNVKAWADICARIDARRRNESLQLARRRAWWARVRRFIRVTTGL